MDRGLANPLATATVIADLVARLSDHGLAVELSNDFDAFAHERLALRGEPPSPMFDPAVAGLIGKGFWIGVRDDDGRMVSLQACRLDCVDTSLADWVVGWMAGLYLKRGELMIPTALKPPSGSRSLRVNGWLVYHGELYMAESVRGKNRLVDTICFLGMMLAYVKWNPDAIWALVSTHIATRGQATRFSYPHVERSFLRWEFKPHDVPANEWLVLAERLDLAHMAEERSQSGIMLTED